MRFLEYKKHLINGEVRDPEFVTNGGHWFDSVTNTYIAVAPDVTDYYLPDTLQELTRDQLNSRVLSIHARVPFMRYDGIRGSGGIQTNVSMTDGEVVDHVSVWIAQLG